MFSCEFWEIFKDTFLYGTRPVAASVCNIVGLKLCKYDIVNNDF